MTNRAKRWAPFAGVVMVALIVIAIAVDSGAPDAKASGAKVITFVHTHQTKIHAADFLFAYAALAAIVYFSSLASYLRSRGADVLATVTFGGGVLMAGGFCFSAGLGEAVVDQPGRLSPQTAQTLNLLVNDSWWMLMIVGLTTATLAAGVSALRTRSLPKALGIVMVVVGVVGASGVLSWFAVLASVPLTAVIAGYLYQRIGRPSEITVPESAIPAQPKAIDKASAKANA